jgi:putative ABC transport system permease protein
MIRFLTKGLLRDRHRSLFPVLVVFIGVLLTTSFYGLLIGAAGNIFEKTSVFETGHVKIMSRAYAEIASQMPNDLALSGFDELMRTLKKEYPGLEWAPRIKFGGLLDIPDENGETRSQGPVMGIALDLFNPDTGENERLELEPSLVRGRLPLSPGEIVMGESFADELGVSVGDMATLLGATSKGSMSVQNFTLVGTVHFGIAMMDRRLMLADLSDIQYALDMEDGVGEILGFLPNMVWDQPAADRITEAFNRRYQNTSDEYAPAMITFRDQQSMGVMMDYVAIMMFGMAFFFLFFMSIILWNTGLMSGLRRYGEMGVRLALGEAKGHVYRSLIIESLSIGMGICYYFQEVGFDIMYYFRGGGADVNLAMTNVIRAKVTPGGFFIGLIPGLFSTVLGTMISGLGIFRRQTSTLFKELEA